MISFHAWGQAPRMITGHVKSSDDNSTLPGVNVLEKGTTNGTVTDASGHYQIKVQNENSILIFSFIGYASQERAVANSSEISVDMMIDVATLEEVVLIGYDEIKKSDATGSLSQINTKTFNRGVVNSPQELISGKIAGVVITSNSGAPGNASTIRIRGGASLSASNDPLIVIDGVPISNNNLGGSPNVLATINPNDIESVTVLKDASAAAIFGARASNGVIMITTKRGSGAFKVTYNVTASVYTTPKKVEVFNGDEFRDLINTRFEGNTNVTQLLGDANTDWQEEIYQTAVGMDHNINVSGTAVKKVPYRVSVGYNNTDGILKTYNFERTTLSLGLDPTLLKDKLKISINVKGMINNNNFADQGAIGDAIGYDPTKPVFNGNTRWRGYTTWTTGGIDGDGINLAPGNPVARLAMTDNTSVVKRSIGNAKVDYEIPFLKDLHATLNVGYDYAETKGRNNVKDNTQWIYLPSEAGGRINPYAAKSKNELLDFYMNYTKEIPSLKSKAEIMAGYSWLHYHIEGSDSTMNQQREETTRVNIYESEYYNLSFFGRLNYTFNNRYLLTATLRNDATSRFAPENRWGMFPAVALAWKIHEEPFMVAIPQLSKLKLRVGWGVTGQQDVAGDYPYIATYTISDNAARYPFGSTFYNTLRPDAYDQNIKWEETTTVNAGLDFGLFTNLITGSIDVYRKKSNDLLAFIPVPVGTNFSSNLTTNVGNCYSNGIELSLNAEVISRDKVQWSVGYNISYNRNKIDRLNLSNDSEFMIPLGGVGGTTSGTIQVHKVGHPRASFFVYQQVYDENGNPVEDVYVDRNEDGLINTADMRIYKQPEPVVQMGVFSSLKYGNWDFSFAGRASFGNYVYNNVAANSTYRSLYNSMEFLMNVSKLADDTKFTNALNTRFSDYYIENASFFRVDNINAGYTFNDLYKDRLNVRVGVGVQNAFVITKYSGLDPEISGGLDNNFFPRTRAFLLNVNVEF
jgi:iron complex outermembrane receptor protein